MTSKYSPLKSPAGIFLILSFFLFVSCIFDRPPRILISQDTYTADGISGGHFLYTEPNAGIQKLNIEDESGAMKILRKQSSSEGLTIYFQSTGNPGIVRIQTVSGIVQKIQFLSGMEDSDNDGFPDLAELKSREDQIAFRKWFIAISLAQYRNRTAAWVRNQRDCSGLIRFAYREALKKHSLKWRKKIGISLDLFLHDVKQYNYPNVPILGSAIFKVNGQPAHNRDSFHNFAEAERLMSYHTRFVSRDLQQALSGDILFFEDKRNWKEPYHSMIAVRDDSGMLRFLYHTGSNDVMKLVDISYLDRFEVFQPRSDNPHFLGIYRFKILEQ